ncbi:MAG: hypothetical protein LAQ30_26765 [Acidobacteriia bacterium]|nr:hypothetical protein [Terriglobia bacterium]
MMAQNVLLRQKRTELAEQAEAILTAALSESRALTAAENSKVSLLVTRGNGLTEEIRSIEAEQDRQRNSPGVAVAWSEQY